MATVYGTSVIATTDPTDPDITMYKVSGFDGIPHATLMIDPVKPRALVYSPIDNVTGADVRSLLTAAGGMAEIKAAAQATAPSQKQRNDLNTWLSGGGFDQLTSAQVNWWDIFHYAAWQVNPAMNLDNIFVVG